MFSREGGNVASSARAGRIAGMDLKRGKESVRKHTSWNHPHTTFGDGKLVRLGLKSTYVLSQSRRADIHQYLALMHKEHHLHLAGIFRPLETLWW